MSGRTAVHLTSEQRVKLLPLIEKHMELCDGKRVSFLIGQLLVLDDVDVELVVRHMDRHEFQVFISDCGGIDLSEPGDTEVEA